MNFLALGTVSAAFFILMLLQQRRPELILRNLLGLREAVPLMAAVIFVWTDDFVYDLVEN